MEVALDEAKREKTRKWRRSKRSVPRSPNAPRCSQLFRRSSKLATSKDKERLSRIASSI